MVAIVFLQTVVTSFAQVAPGPHPAAAFPGDWLQFRSDRKLTGRSPLVGSITPPAVSSATNATPPRASLPTISSSSVTVDIYAVPGVVERADFSIQNISTSDGYSMPALIFSYTFATNNNNAQVGFDSFPSLPGFIVNTSAGTVSAPNPDILTEPQQHLIYAVMANLASLFQNATHVSVARSTASLPVWSISQFIASATTFTNLLFQPNPTLWSLFIGARQSLIAFQPSAAGAGSVNLPATDSNAGVLASNATWGLGWPGYDLDHNGQPTYIQLDINSKIGSFIAGSNTFQKVEFGSAFSCDNNASNGACVQYGRLYQWQNGGWQQQWITAPIATLFEAQAIVGDFDGDGRLEVAAAPWYNMQVYDLLTGQLKTSATFTPKDAESGRNYGWAGAFDLDGSGKQALIEIGNFQNFLAVLGWKDGQLVKLWDHLIEASIEARQTVHVITPYPVQDIDSDGKYEIVTSIYNETGDGQWHIVGRDALTGAVVLDLPQRYLVGMTDINGDGAPELFTLATNGLEMPAYGQIDVLSYRGGSPKTLLALSGAAFATQQVQSLPLNINATNEALTTVLTGPITAGGSPVFFTQRLLDQLAGTVEVTVWQWVNGALAKTGTITGPNLQVTATRPAPSGSPGFLVTAAVRGIGAGNITVNGVSGVVVQSGLMSAPLSSAVVGHLRPGDPPVVIVQNALEELVAFRPSSATRSGTVVWNHLGRGGYTGDAGLTGQYTFSGPLLASLAGDGSLQTIAAMRAPSGQARVVAIQPDGSDFWTSDFPRFPGQPPIWNEGGVTLSFAGRFRRPDREDVLIATRRGADGSEELNLLDGATGQLVWNDTLGNTPGTSYNQRAPGEGQAAIYDWNQDGLDEIVNTQPDVFWVKDGNDKNLIDRSFSYGTTAVFGNFPVYYGTPAVADFLNNGTDSILFGGSAYMLGLMSPQASAIWNTGFETGSPGVLQGIADLDGDGALSLVNAGVPGQNGQSMLTVLRAATGKTLWSIPLPGCGQSSPGGWTTNAPTPVTTADINGDGRDEAVFACGSKIYVVGANPGNQSGRILWTLDMGAMLDTPIVADAEGNGHLEIVVVASNGYIYGIGSQPSTAPPAANAPAIAANGVVEAATFRPGQVAPGGWFSILGANLSDGKYQAAASPLPRQLGGTVVTVNGQIARLDYVDTGQINAEMPPDMPLGAASVVVTTNAGSSRAPPSRSCRRCRRFFKTGQIEQPRRMSRTTASTARATRYRRAEA